MAIRKDLGIATAYGYAVSKGYTGTEEEFAVLMASYASVGQTATQAAESASESATASAGSAAQSAQSATNASNSATAASTSETNAAGSATDAGTEALKAEGVTLGKQNGVDVGNDSPYYHANTKYYSEQAQATYDQAVAVKNSIPADYTALSGEVNELKADLSESVSDLKNAFEHTAPYDIVAYGEKATKTVTDVTFIWHGNTCTVNGTAGGNRHHPFYDSPNALPAGVVHGSQLYVQCESSNSGVLLQIRYYNGTTHILLVETTTDTKVTIPNDAIGIMLRIVVANGTVCTDAAITMSVLTAETNVDLTRKMQDVIAYTMALDKANATTLTEESDIDQLTVGNYVIQNSTVAQALSLPMLAGGRLYTMDGNANNRFLQMYITLGDSRNRNLAFRGFNGTNWSEWWQCETSDNTASAIASAEAVLALKTIQGTNETLTAQDYAPYTSYNDLPMDSIIAVNRAPLEDGPTGDAFLINDDSTNGYQRGICMTVTQSSTGATSTAFQIFVGYYSAISNVPIISYRTAVVSSGVRTWSPWAKLSQDRFLGATNIVIRASTAYKWFTDLNDVPINTIYQIDKDCVSGVLANHPAPGYSAVLMTYAFAVSTRHGMVQTLYSLQSNEPVEYIRYGWLNNTDDYRWTPWRKVVTEAVL